MPECVHCGNKVGAEDHYCIFCGNSRKPEPARSAGDGSLDPLDGYAAESDRCEWCGREVKRGELTPIYDIAPTGERDWVCASCLQGSIPIK